MILDLGRRGGRDALGSKLNCHLCHGPSLQGGYRHISQVVSVLVVILEQLILLSGAISLDSLLTSVEAWLHLGISSFCCWELASFGYCISSFGNVV